MSLGFNARHANWWKRTMHNRMFCVASIVVLAVGSFGFRFDSLYTICLILTGVCLIGIPHGGLDHLAGRKHLHARWGKYWVVPFFGIYLSIAVLTVFGWMWSPLFTSLLFFIVSSSHFGKEDAYMEEHSLPLRWLRDIASGGLVVWIPAIARPIEMREILDGIIPESMAMTGSSIVAWTQLLAAFLVPLALLDVLLPLRSSSTRSDLAVGRLIRHAILTSLFALTPIPISFAIYFCGWHSVRGMRNLMHEHNMRIGELAVAAMPMTVGAIAIVGLGMWYWYSGRSLSIELTRTLFIGLSAMAVPHLVLHSLPKWFERSIELTPIN